jgi:AraC-like DNA-binding protein
MERASALRRRKLLAYGQALGWPAYLQINEGLIDQVEYARLLDLIARHAPRDFALRFGLARRLVELGLLGHVFLSCRKLREVLDVWLSHADSAGELVRVKAEIDEASGLWIITQHPDRVLSAAARRFCIEELTATFFAFCQDVTGDSYADFVAEIEHEAHQGLDIPEGLQGSLRFGCGRNRIAGPSDVLDRATRGRDDETFALLFDQFIHAEQADASRRGAVAQALRNYFMLGHSRVPSQADAARWLGMSRRSLVLRLAGEGTSYSEILDDHRRRYVLASLDEGMLCTKQIAHAVGFAHENSLRRAFRKWTGSSIRTWTGSRH